MGRRRLLYLIIGLLTLAALLVFMWLLDPPCFPPPPCTEADAKAGRCTPRPYPCTES
jgi:hypothetical protein